VQPDDGLGPAARRRELVDVQGRGVAREQRAGTRPARDLAEHLFLEGQALEDGLDDEIGRRTAFVAGDALNPGQALRCRSALSRPRSTDDW
jgi:hypothetical protein